MARRHVEFLLKRAATDRVIQFRNFAVLFDNDDFAGAVALTREATRQPDAGLDPCR